jgi:hypothetical protein
MEFALAHFKSCTPNFGRPSKPRYTVAKFGHQLFVRDSAPFRDSDTAVPASPSIYRQTFYNDT